MQGEHADESADLRRTGIVRPLGQRHLDCSATGDAGADTFQSLGADAVPTPGDGIQCAGERHAAREQHAGLLGDDRQLFGDLRLPRRHRPVEQVLGCAVGSGSHTERPGERKQRSDADGTECRSRNDESRGCAADLPYAELERGPGHAGFAQPDSEFGIGIRQQGDALHQRCCSDHCRNTRFRTGIAMSRPAHSQQAATASTLNATSS